VIGVQIVGMDELDKKLKRLKSTAARRALRKGVGVGTRYLAKQAKSRVHRGHGGVPGLLKKSIGNKVQTYRNNGVSVGIIGPRKGFLHILNGGQRVDPVKYSHIEEKGRKAVITKKKKVLSNGKVIFGRSVAAYQGRPFMAPTAEQDGGKASQQVGDATMRAIEAEAKKT